MASLAGKFLVAKPVLNDANFSRTVVLLLQHGPDGAFGLVVNRPADAPEAPVPVFVGGPCKFQGLILLHDQEEWVESEERPSAEVCPGVFLGDADCLKRIADPPPGHGWKFRVFTGYSGWGPGQLEAEMKEGAWAIVPANAHHLFDTSISEMWVRLVPSSIPNPSMN